eukprot:6843883-Prorocentrum_lima.AAC.1
MTSSLVGSEMCIRDRRPSHTPPPIARPNCDQNRSGARGSAPARQTRNPVSYTHLTLPTICSV